uniref:Small ribosomal subunit protein eS21 n=1 Tax=Echeneis naucrates TaxID=173247 RepID=A0A665VC53_ECHNA
MPNRKLPKCFLVFEALTVKFCSSLTLWQASINLLKNIYFDNSFSTLNSIHSASNRIIGAKDHASIQINIAEVDKVTGRFNGQFKTYAICGAIRRMGESDDSILRLAKNDTIVAK